MHETTISTNNLGYPRIGAKRELKKATEAYWKGKASAEELKDAGRALRAQNWQTQREAGIDLIPSNDFSYYDQMLDMSCLLNVVPPRFGWDGEQIDLDIMFSMARGMATETGTEATFACEMTKWFDTNYHYIVPEFSNETSFRVTSRKVFAEFSEALALGIKTKPVLIGPITFLTLGKVTSEGFDQMSMLDALLPVYGEILAELRSLGAEWVQLDEPVFALDLDESTRAAARRAYDSLSAAAPGLRLLVTSYFGELRDNRSTYLNLPVDALHIDLARGGSELPSVLEELPDDKILSAGIVDGRNIWKNDFDVSLTELGTIRESIGANRLMVAPTCSLIHSPVTLRNEVKLDAELSSWLAGAEEKLVEVATLAKIASGSDEEAALTANRKARESRKTSQRIHNERVKARSDAVTHADTLRASPFAKRDEIQRDALGLPEYPTTTIGSFPQTREVRQARAKNRKGELSDAEYREFLEGQITEAVRAQEEIGVDVLVHGEFERNDMVEYFGEQLEGFAFTQHAWVQSFGSRYVKPPIIYGDVWRPNAMTVEWSRFAQSKTDHIMKGMLTGPITVLQWSFVRDDQPRSETARQIALALRDEVVDLEAAGIRIIQVDEPALREGLPLRRSDWKVYLDWAGEAFRLSVSGVADATQIHTHMCYAEFNDIIESIAALDADVISMESSRSRLELLDAFVEFEYPNQIGPGVYDIHSPRVPTTDEIVALLTKAKSLLPPRNLWVNPDCGLKTRGWDEVMPSLVNMVAAAKTMRLEHNA